MMKWISVKERLPAHGERVIVCREGGKVEQGYKDVLDWWKVYGTRTKRVTHWMPLPDPPTAQDHLRDATKMMPRDIDADAPTIDPESLRQRGRWEKATLNGYLCCSACKDVYIYEDWLADGKWSFCPNCGAKMDKEKSEWNE